MTSRDSFSNVSSGVRNYKALFSDGSPWNTKAVTISGRSDEIIAIFSSVTDLS